jgi:hypothetical protein
MVQHGPGTKTEQPDYFPDERGGCRGEGTHSDCALAEIGTASTPGMPDSRPYVWQKSLESVNRTGRV